MGCLSAYCKQLSLRETVTPTMSPSLPPLDSYVAMGTRKEHVTITADARLRDGQGALGAGFGEVSKP